MRAFVKCPACGDKFCALRDPDFEPPQDAVMQANWFEHIDGKPIIAGDQMQCDSCGGLPPPGRAGFTEIIKEEAS